MASDRQSLAERNRKLAAEIHKPSWRERIRSSILRTWARLPRPTRARAEPGRILLIRPDHLGDLLFMTPALRALRRARPDDDITLLVGPWGAGVMAAYSQPQRILTLPFPGFTRAPGSHAIWMPYLLASKWAAKLRKLRIETAVIMRPDHWWGALLAYMAGIPNRIGYKLPDVEPFLTTPIPFEPAHAVRLNARVLEHWTGVLTDEQLELTYPVDPIDRAYIKGYLGEWGVADGEPVVVIHPGSGRAVKLWRVDGWIEVANALADLLGARIVLTGGEHETEMTNRIAAGLKGKPVRAAGDTDIGQLAALFSRASLVLGPDSGPLHLAVAVGTPTVHLYGPADPAQFGPWGDPARHRVVASDIGCRPCGILDWGADDLANHPCVRDITPSAVIDAAIAALEGRE